VYRIAKKKQMKCMARKKPASADNAIACRCSLVRHSEFFIAIGAISAAPPRFRQNTNAGTGMMLAAMTGPEVPTPIIPRDKRPRSLAAGIAVWSCLLINER
jgi:hypothetical protein